MRESAHTPVFVPGLPLGSFVFAFSAPHLPEFIITTFCFVLFFFLLIACTECRSGDTVTLPRQRLSPFRFPLSLASYSSLKLSFVARRSHELPRLREAQLGALRAAHGPPAQHCRRCPLHAQRARQGMSSDRTPPLVDYFLLIILHRHYVVRHIRRTCCSVGLMPMWAHRSTTLTIWARCTRSS